MSYAFWANTTAVVHGLIIVGVIIGLLVSFRYKRFRPWEAMLLISIFILWSYYGNCPLAILEQHLRELAGQDVNITELGFTTYYMQKLFGLHVSSHLVQQTTFFSGAVFFGASIEWFAPFFHRPIFYLRKSVRKMRLVR